MIETDPIHEVERTLATQFARAIRRVQDWSPTELEVHFREDTIVFLAEGEPLPPSEPDVRQALDDAINDVLRRTIGRTAASPYECTLVTPRSALVVLRLT